MKSEVWYPCENFCLENNRKRLSHQSALSDADGSVHFCSEPFPPAPGESSHCNRLQAKRRVQYISSVFISRGCRRLSTMQGKRKSLSPGSKKTCSVFLPTTQCLSTSSWKDSCWGGGLLGCKHHIIHNRRKITELFKPLERGNNFQPLLNRDLVLNPTCGKNIHLPQPFCDWLAASRFLGWHV